LARLGLGYNIKYTLDISNNSCGTGIQPSLELAFHSYVYSFPQKTDRKPHRFPHHRTTIAIGTCFLPREQLFPKQPGIAWQ
jgi:hypothetical protein